MRPINVDVTAGLHKLYRDLAIGLGVLYLILFALSMSLSRGLRQQLTRNKFLAEHDLLTDLPNRALFHRYAKAAVHVGGAVRIPDGARPSSISTGSRRSTTRWVTTTVTSSSPSWRGGWPPSPDPRTPWPGWAATSSASSCAT